MAQIPPDVSLGYGTEVVETGGWFVNLGWLGIALVLTVIGYLAWRQRRKKAVIGGIGSISIGVPELLLVVAAIAVVAYLVLKLLRQ